MVGGALDWGSGVLLILRCGVEMGFGTIGVGLGLK